jgi:putative transposase
VLETGFDPYVFRALLSLKPWQSPTEISRLVKGNLATEVRKRLGKSGLWSRGWFFRSAGHVTNETIREYISRQYAHHNAAPVDNPDLVALARFHAPSNPAELRRGTHVVFEYNTHIVFVTNKRSEVFDLHLAEALLHYWQQVCEQKRWKVWDMEIVWNHAHLFLGALPNDAPSTVALSLMNNSEYFLQKYYGAALREFVTSTVWRPSYYAGTAGSATTAQIKAFLRDEWRF